MTYNLAPKMPLKHRKTILAVFAMVMGASAVTFMTPDARYVATPVFACIILVFWLWLALWDRDKSIPIIDVGMICALAILAYSVYPLLNYWVGGLRFGPLSDVRLQTYRISPRELGLFHLRHVLYLSSFVIAYATFRAKGLIKTGQVRLPSQSARLVILLIFLLLSGYFVVLQLTTGVDFNSSYASEAYAGYLSAMANIPLLLLQISVKLGGILFIFKLALLFIVVSRCKLIKWRIILFGWVLAEIIQAITIKGARTELILFLMATIICYHRLIKPLSINKLVFLGSIIFVGFLYMGVYRSYYDVSEMRIDIMRNNTSMFGTSNEFQSLLGTEYDVLRRKESGAYLPWYLYINDFITVLPPQQLMPFEKVTASEWYLREIGQSGTGVGYMWGVISQSIVGLDWVELIIRGALLGYILSWFHRWYINHQKGFIETLIYVFICLKVYYTFRDTTFSLLSNVVWELIPFYIILRIGTAIISRQTTFAPTVGPFIRSEK